MICILDGGCNDNCCSGRENKKSGSWLDIIEKVGNKVPHPVLMFLYLIIFVIVLSQILAWAGVSVTEQIAVPVATRFKCGLLRGYDPTWDAGS